MLVGTNLQYANSFNNRIVLETIRLYGPLSRIDIAKRSQLTAQTVTNITKKLMMAGLVLEDSRQQLGRGAPAIRLKLNYEAAYAIGLDVDKDHMTAIMLNLGGEICQKVHIELNYPEPEEVLLLMSDTVHELIARQKIDKEQIWGVGVALPGPMAATKGSEFANIVSPQAMPTWENVPVVKRLEEKISLPVVLKNNASAAAMGELWYGNAKHINSFFYVYIGAGLGGGLVVNGQLYAGETGNAGELGYFPSGLLTSDDSEEFHDHVGAYFRFPELIRSISKDGSGSPEMLASLYDEGHPEVHRMINGAIKKLIPLVLSVEYLLDPEVIFFGGHLPDAIIEKMILTLKEELPKLRVDRKNSHPDFRIASTGFDAAALGVATFPLYSSFAPLPKLLMKQQKTGATTFDRSSEKDDDE